MRDVLGQVRHLTCPVECLMTYYPDGAAYTYHEDGCAPHLITIGWLEPPHAYPQGQSDVTTHTALWRFVRQPVMATRGWYTCPWCAAPPLGPLPVQWGDQTLGLGTAEIRVFGADGTIYAAPDLIYHYVVDHRYRPPAAFLDALRHGPQPGTAAYQDLLDRSGWD